MDIIANENGQLKQRLISMDETSVYINEGDVLRVVYGKLDITMKPNGVDVDIDVLRNKEHSAYMNLSQEKKCTIKELKEPIMTLLTSGGSECSKETIWGVNELMIKYFDEEDYLYLDEDSDNLEEWIGKYFPK